MLTKLENFLPTKEPASIENFLFFWISKVNARYSNLIEKSVKNLGIDNTRRKIILTSNALGETNITAIANMATLKLTTATKAIYRLVDDGILTVSPSTEDERITMVRLTDKGMDFVEKIHQINMIALAGILHSFNDEELTQLNAQLKKLYEIIPV